MNVLHHVSRFEDSVEVPAVHAPEKKQGKKGGVNIFSICHKVPRMAGSPTYASHKMAEELDFLANRQRDEQAGNPTIYKYNPRYYYIYLKDYGRWLPLAKRDGPFWHLCFRFWVKKFPMMIFDETSLAMGLEPRDELDDAISSMIIDFWNGSKHKRNNPKWFGEVQSRKGNRKTCRRGPRGRRR